MLINSNSLNYTLLLTHSLTLANLLLLNHSCSLTHDNSLLLTHSITLAPSHMPTHSYSLNYTLLIKRLLTLPHLLLLNHSWSLTHAHSLLLIKLHTLAHSHTHSSSLAYSSSTECSLNQKNNPVFCVLQFAGTRHSWQNNKATSDKQMEKSSWESKTGKRKKEFLWENES